MEWWAALLVAGVPVVITSVSLLVQQRFNARASERADESRRMDAEAERQHQERLLEVSNRHAREQAEQDHRRQTREAWKEDRRAAHKRLLTRLEEIQSEASTLLSGISVDLSIGDLPPDTEFVIPVLPSEFVADVALVCSDKSAHEARKASAAVATLAIAIAMIEVMHETRSKDELRSDLDDARNQWAKLSEAVSAYRQAAKQDIDTVD